MSVLDSLWTYQQADLLVDQYEAEMRQNPMRKKLVKLRNFFKEQQDAMKAAEEGTERSAAALVQARELYAQVNARLSAQMTQIEESAYESAQQVKEKLTQIEALAARLDGLLAQLEELNKEAGRMGQELKSARTNAAKAKADYTQLKEQYDSEFAVQSQKLEQLKAQRDAHVSGIAPAVLARYQAVKKRATPPMAIPEGDKCGGCKMSLPAMIINNAKRGEQLVECETCGRILYIP